MTVDESTADMHTTTGFFVHNSVTVQIDDELINFSAVNKAAPFGFTGCTRGAFGTKPAAHAQGAAVHHLFVRYATFQPDERSTLVGEIADCIANVFNTCGFDMIYMDGAEGMPGDWYGIAKMRLAIFERLKGRVLVEASEWGHHSWPFHSRLGAYDYPNWGLDRFNDIHCHDLEGYRASSLLPAQLGWWAILGPDADHPAEFPEEVEYLCAKSLGYDAPMSFQGIEPTPRPANLRQPEYLEMIGRFERLRLARHFSEATLARLRTPRQDFHLIQAAGDQWQLAPRDYLAHKVTGQKDGSGAWTLTNRYASQPLRLRIEALYAALPYAAPEGVALATLAKPDELAARGAAGVTASWAPAGETPAADASPALPSTGTCSAKSTLATRTGAWAAFARTFNPPLNLSKCGALGLWVRGDGKGELLNVQLTNPPQFWTTFDEHYLPIDFTGWRYVELFLRERDAESFVDYAWPYGGTSEVFRSPLIRDHVSGLTLWYNNLPPGDAAACQIGPIKALPAVKAKLGTPTLTLGDRKIVFPVTLESGQYIELDPDAGCRLFSEQGEVLQKVAPQGDAPAVATGENRIAFSCEPPQGLGARAKITVIVQGEPLAATNKPEN